LCQAILTSDLYMITCVRFSACLCKAKAVPVQVWTGH